MSDETWQSAEYTMGYSDEFRQLLNRRSLQTHAMHLLPHLKPGLRTLDFGCGPGTLSVGLARAVEPGEMHGIDMEASQIELARAAATAGGHANAAFHVGNAMELPFEDDYFDVAHCHTVLMHIPDTQATLAEVKRVLRPGGIIASRELVGSSCFLEPNREEFDIAWQVFLRLLDANDGHPEMGKKLKSAFLEAEFTDIHATLSFDSFGSAEDIAFLHSFINGWFFYAGSGCSGNPAWLGDSATFRRDSRRAGRMEPGKRSRRRPGIRRVRGEQTVAKKETIGGRETDCSISLRVTLVGLPKPAAKSINEMPDGAFPTE